MRILTSALLISALAAPMAQAQQDSFFDSYDDYAAFVDKHVMERNFAPMILRLGGRDEYTPEQLAATVTQLETVWPKPFDGSAVFNRKELGGGLWQEGRVYWNGLRYAYFYALLHDREDAFVVLSFNLHSSSKPIMERF